MLCALLPPIGVGGGSLMAAADWIFGDTPTGYISTDGFEIRETPEAWVRTDTMLHLKDCV